MENVQQADCSLLYPDTHTLKIIEENEIYAVKLELTLNKM